MKIPNSICHQRPERSFFYKKKQFPVCSRCTGIIVGALIFLIINFIFPINYNPLLIIISIVLLLPLIVDGVTQELGFRTSNNTLRFITGLLYGIAILYIIFNLIAMLKGFIVFFIN